MKSQIIFVSLPIIFFRLFLYNLISVHHKEFMLACVVNPIMQLSPIAWLGLQLVSCNHISINLWCFLINPKGSFSTCNFTFTQITREKMFEGMCLLKCMSLILSSSDYLKIWMFCQTLIYQLLGQSSQLQIQFALFRFLYLHPFCLNNKTIITNIGSGPNGSKLEVRKLSII